MVNVEAFSAAIPGELVEAYDASDQLYLNYLTTMTSLLYLCTLSVSSPK